MLELEVLDLPVADAMLTGTGAAERNRALGQATRQLLCGCELLGAVGVDQDGEVEVAVTDVTDEWCQEAGLLEVGLRLLDALLEPRDRDADIRDEASRSRPERERGLVGLMPSLPEAATFGRARGCLEGSCSELPRDALDLRCLVAHLAVAAMELEEKGWRKRIVGARRRLIASSWIASSSSIRATGIPICRVRTTHSTAWDSAPNGQTAARIASGVGWSLSVTSVITPSVPSEPMKSRVRS